MKTHRDLFENCVIPPPEKALKSEAHQFSKAKSMFCSVPFSLKKYEHSP